MTDRAWVLPPSTGPSAPTVAELEAGTEITGLLVEGPGPSFTDLSTGSMMYATSSVLTREALTAAFKLMWDQPYTICAGSDVHCVSPSEMAHGGLARCASCFAVVDLGAGRFAPSEGRWTGRWEP